MATPNPQLEKPRRSRATIIIAAVVALAIILTGGWYLLSKDGNGHKAPPFAKIGTNVWRSQNDPNDMKAVKTTVRDLPYSSRMKSAITPVEITPAGELRDKDGKPTKATLRFKLDQKIDPTKQFVLVVTSETGAAPWQRIQPAISKDGRYAQVTTTHLSTWDVIIGKFSDFTLDFAHDLAHALTGTNAPAQKPKCSDAPSTNDASGYGASYTNKNTMYVCLNKENGGAALYTVNRKNYPLLATYTSNLTVTEKGETNDKWFNLIPSPGKNTFIQWPGDKARTAFTFKPGDNGRVRTEFSSYAELLYSLDVGTSSLINILDRFGIAHPGGDSFKYKLMKGALLFRDCSDSIRLHKSPAEMFAACLPHIAEGDPFGKIGTEIILNVVKFSTSLATYINSEISSLYDSIKGDDVFSVLVGRVKVNPFGTIKGTWYVGPNNSSTLIINPDGTGTYAHPIGPCNPNDEWNSPSCNSITDVTFKPGDNGTFVGTYGKTVYRTYDGSTWPSTAGMPPSRTGRTFTLWVYRPNVLAASPGGLDSPEACRKGSSEMSTVCGE